MSSSKMPIPGTVGHLLDDLEALVKVNKWARDAVLTCRYAGLEKFVWRPDSSGIMSSDVVQVGDSQFFNALSMVHSGNNPADILRQRYFDKAINIKIDASRFGLDNQLAEISSLTFSEWPRKEEWLVSQMLFWRPTDVLFEFPQAPNASVWHSRNSLKTAFPLHASYIDHPIFMALFQPSTFSHQVFRCKYTYDIMKEHVFVDPSSRLASLESPIIECSDGHVKKCSPEYKAAECRVCGLQLRLSNKSDYSKCCGNHVNECW